MYRDGDETSGDEPCQVRAGFAQFIDTTRFPMAEADLAQCMADLCGSGSTTTNCLVVTGGGGQANPDGPSNAVPGASADAAAASSGGGGGGGDFSFILVVGLTICYGALHLLQ